MRLKTLALSSVSTLILLTAASPALAQPVEAQESPADPEGALAPDAADEIVVTGLRESLRSSQNLKRNSDQIVDAIVAEDIGKLPDIAVSDTAARIPGIQVERSGGEASRVLLRGLDRFNYTTTYNGREIFTAETRSVALQDFPAGGISAIEAFKTSTANLVEPGIAGLINVRSRRPFDFRGMEIAGSVWGHYPDQSQDFEPNAQLLLSNRWDTGAGEIGALINFSYTRFHYRDSVRRHGFFIADLAGGRSPDWPEIRYFEAERSRPSVNGALQWRPSADLEFYAEGLWQGFREDSTDRMWAQPLWGGASYEDVVIEGGQVISGTVNGPTACCGAYRTWGYQGATKRRTNTYQFAVGGRWQAGDLRVTGDLARTDSTFNLMTESVDYEINRTDYSVDWFTGRRGGPGPTFQVRGLDVENPANYTYRGFYEDHLTASGDDWQARLDFHYEAPGLDFLPSIQWGVRYVDRTAARDAGDFYWNLTAQEHPGRCCGSMLPAGMNPIPITAVPLDYVMTRRGFRGDRNQPAPMSWLAPTFDSIWNNLEELRQFNIGITGQGSINGPAMEPHRSFDINERSLAGYAQVNYEFDAGDVTVDGAIGMRVVKTDATIRGTVATSTGTAPLVFENAYTDWLPNASMRIRFSPEWQARLSVSETRTRPTFEQLNPAFELAAPPVCAPGASDCIRTGSTGNPFLVPLESTNFDASLEYYFSRTGFASIAVFDRNMRGFVANRAIEFPEADPETGLPLVVTAPVNTRNASIYGFEAQFSTFFDFLPGPLSGFGMQANVTYINAEAEFLFFPEEIPNPDVDGPPMIPNPTHTEIRTRIPDVSRWSYNLVGMYERGPLTARLAYNRRSSFPEADRAERDGFFTLQGYGAPVSRLDWSSSFAVSENLTFFFDWTNILADPFRSDIVRVNYADGGPTSSERFPMVVRFEESTLTGGIRFRF